MADKPGKIILDEWFMYILNMDFVRSNFGTNEPLPVEHFFPHFLGSLLRRKIVESVQL